MQPWPRWWAYEVVISPHAIQRIKERGVSEVDLREMLEDAAGYCPSVTSGRYLITTRRGDEGWEIVVEPDELEPALIIVTAYRVESRQ